MKLFLVMSEANFYQPDFVADFLKKTKDEIVGAALVTRTPPRGNLQLYLIKHFYYLKPLEIIKLGITTLSLIVKKVSVKSVFDHYKIKYFNVENNINQEKYLRKIRKTKPDIIISSNSLYFNKEILSIPKICSLNRHSALLPSYGGLWPVFQAVRSGEKYTGVSVHLMESKIDTGKVLAQEKVLIRRKDTIAELYEKTFDLSARVLLKALDKVRKKNFRQSVLFKSKPSYFQFPTREHWNDFRKLDGKFI